LFNSCAESRALQRLRFNGHGKAPLESISVYNADTPFENARKIPSCARERLPEAILHPFESPF